MVIGLLFSCPLLLFKLHLRQMWALDEDLYHFTVWSFSGAEKLVCSVEEQSISNRERGERGIPVSPSNR